MSFILVRGCNVIRGNSHGGFTFIALMSVISGFHICVGVWKIYSNSNNHVNGNHCWTAVPRSVVSFCFSLKTEFGSNFRAPRAVYHNDKATLIKLTSFKAIFHKLLLALGVLTKSSTFSLPDSMIALALIGSVITRCAQDMIFIIGHYHLLMFAGTLLPRKKRVWIISAGKS